MTTKQQTTLLFTAVCARGLEPPIDEIDRKKLVWMREKETGLDEREGNWFG